MPHTKLKSSLNAYLELTKPRILLLVLITTALGYYLGAQGAVSYIQGFYLLLGAGLVCAGSGVLNHYIERDIDKMMERTKKRPLPLGLISANNALSFGIVLVFVGLFILYTRINILTAFLSLLTAFLYIVVYTPMKRMSWLNTSVGAIPGALPPLGGWAAATGTLNFDAGMLFLILYIWQHPHFYAIAWMYKDDYARGGFKMLPCVEPDGERTFKQIFWYSLILIPVSITPTLLGMSGMIYCVGALILGVLMFMASQKLIQSHSILDARRLLRATVIYLPLLLILIVADVTF